MNVLLKIFVFGFVFYPFVDIFAGTGFRMFLDKIGIFTFPEKLCEEKMEDFRENLMYINNLPNDFKDLSYKFNEINKNIIGQKKFLNKMENVLYDIWRERIKYGFDEKKCDKKEIERYKRENNKKCKILYVTGEPGVGKTQIVKNFVETLYSPSEDKYNKDNLKEKKAPMLTPFSIINRFDQKDVKEYGEGKLLFMQMIHHRKYLLDSDIVLMVKALKNCVIVLDDIDKVWNKGMELFFREIIDRGYIDVFDIRSKSNNARIDLSGVVFILISNEKIKNGIGIINEGNNNATKNREEKKTIVEHDISFMDRFQVIEAPSLSLEDYILGCKVSFITVKNNILKDHNVIVTIDDSEIKKIAEKLLKLNKQYRGVIIDFKENLESEIGRFLSRQREKKNELKVKFKGFDSENIFYFE